MAAAVGVGAAVVVLASARNLTGAAVRRPAPAARITIRRFSHPHLVLGWCPWRRCGSFAPMRYRAFLGWLATAWVMPIALAADDEPAWREPIDSEVIALRRVESARPTPAVAVGSSDDLHVIWWEDDGFHEQEFGRSGGAASRERRLTERQQRCYGPARAQLLGEGEFLIVWQCTSDQGLGFVEAALRDTGDGTSLGTAVVAEGLELLHPKMGLAIGSDGRFVVTWAHNNGPSWARSYDRWSVPAGPPTLLCDDCALGPPGVAIQAGRMPMVSWTQSGAVWLAILGPALSLSGGPFPMSSEEYEAVSAPDLTTMENGKVAAAWIGRPRDEREFRVLARKATVEGEPITAEVSVLASSDELALLSLKPRLALSPQRDWLVLLWFAWHREAGKDKREIGVFAQRLDPVSLEPLGSPIRVCSPVRPSSGFELGFDQSGRLLVSGLRPTADAKSDEIWIRWIGPSD